MTTAQSPLWRLKEQAHKMATLLKAAEAGQPTGATEYWKIVEARKKREITFGVFMDDKVLKITMTWSTIRETDLAGIAEFILKHMRESRDAVN